MWGTTVVTVIALIVTLLCAQYFLIQAWRPVTRERVERFARRQSLTVTVTGGPLVVRYLATTRRWRGGGLLLSVIATVALPVLVQVLGPPGSTQHSGVTVSFIALFAGWFAGAVIAEWRINAATAGARRSASLRPRRFSDYLPCSTWVLPVVMWVLLALTDLSGLVSLAVLRPRGLAPLILWTVADIAMVAVLVVVGRRVLTRSQRVSDPDVVETDDAIRSRSLHVLAGSALTIGGYLLTATVYVLAPYSAVLSDGVAGVIGAVCGLLVPVLGYITATATSGLIRQWYRPGDPRRA